jgi:dTDP-4-dehydrorhamnose 3,5-epimerase
MTFTETRLAGAYIIGMEKLEDERGYFARSWCRREFNEHGLDSALVQCSTSFNRKKGTLRGMHYQSPPFAESKLVRCTRGAIADVIVDLRRSSPTFTQWVSAELTPDNGTMIFVPKGFAHGFQTLADDTEVYYQMSEFHAFGSQRGFRWNDPAAGIEWPLPVSTMSDNDRSLPGLTTKEFDDAIHC